MSNPAAKPYDEILYEGYPFPQTHPDRLGAIAKLLGMNPAPLDRCRVLEIACGEGENLVPMAYALPNSTFVGIDLSEPTLARGREGIAALALSNIKLQAMDVRDVTPAFGAFDYIIVHGLYTWVPADVQEKILSVCKQNLTPNGVAYVSYCCFPGGHLRQMIREMLLFHAGDIDDPKLMIEQAVAFGALVSKAGRADDSIRQVVKEELDAVTAMEEAVLFHDLLTPYVTHCYFQEFAARAGKHGLQFLAEADYFEMQHRAWPEDVTSLLQQLAETDVIKKEQYLDLFKFRRFRQTLLCHAGIQLQREPSPERLVDLYLGSAANLASPLPDLRPDVVLEFKGRKGALLATDHPLSKAALIYLKKLWPQAIAFRALLGEARTMLQGAETHDTGIDEDAMVMAEILLRGHDAGLIELRTARLPCVLTVSEKPRASTFARWQLQTRTSATTFRHTPLEIDDPLGRHLVQILDGTRDRTAIVAELTPLVASGLVGLRDDGKPVTDPEEASAVLAKQLDGKLNQLARLGLLEA